MFLILIVFLSEALVALGLCWLVLAVGFCSLSRRERYQKEMNLHENRTG